MITGFCWLQHKRDGRVDVEDEIVASLVDNKVNREMEKARKKCEKEHRQMRKIMAKWSGLGG